VAEGLCAVLDEVDPKTTATVNALAGKLDEALEAAEEESAEAEVSGEELVLESDTEGTDKVDVCMVVDACMVVDVCMVVAFANTVEAMAEADSADVADDVADDFKGSVTIDMGGSRSFGGIRSSTCVSANYINVEVRFKTAP